MTVIELGSKGSSFERREFAEGVGGTAIGGTRPLASRVFFDLGEELVNAVGGVARLRWIVRGGLKFDRVKPEAAQQLEALGAPGLDVLDPRFEIADRIELL